MRAEAIGARVILLGRLCAVTKQPSPQRQRGIPEASLFGGIGHYMLSVGSVDACLGGLFCVMGGCIPSGEAYLLVSLHAQICEILSRTLACSASVTASPSNSQTPPCACVGRPTQVLQRDLSVAALRAYRRLKLRRESQSSTSELQQQLQQQQQQQGRRDDSHTKACPGGEQTERGRGDGRQHRSGAAAGPGRRQESSRPAARRVLRVW